MAEDMFEEAQEPARSEWPARQSDSGENRSARPLADRLRPTEFGDFMGQEKLVGQNAPLRRLIDGNRVPSMILWGPPGSGKTTLASLIARTTDSDFITLSAVTSGIKDVRGVIDIAKVNRQYARKTILFIDEIHRFNKAQQDAFLPHVESGLITLIGATTENPSFSVIAPLLSRCRVFTLAAIEDTHLVQLLQRAVPELNEVEEEPPIEVESEALDAIVQLSDGDARRALGILEIAADVAREQHAEAEAAPITRDDVVAVVQRHLMYDRGGEEHFNLISALHKTIRSSDPHGALYWCERMLAGGEDPRFILRRLIRAASEDVGLAAPNALVHAVACLDAFEKIGQPEGNIFVSQLAVALAMAPKSNAIYMASKRTAALIQETGTLPVPLHLRNAPTGLMKSEGYSDGYTYDHDEAGHFVPKQGLPDELEGTALYEPTDQGQEARLQERLSELDAARAEERAARKKP